MAPEQLEGEPADTRTDIFALGLVLYEMASGRRPFEGKSHAEAVAAVMRGEPGPIGKVPRRFERLVKRCLASDPALRWQSAADIKLELDDTRSELKEGETDERQSANAARLEARRRWAFAGAGLTALLFAFGAGLFVAAPDAPDPSHHRFVPIAFEPGGQGGGIWSPDGKALAYAARGDTGRAQIFVRRLDADVPLQVTHLPESATPLAWSPDSHRIWFRSSHPPAGIWWVAAVGGEPEPALSLDLGRIPFGGIAIAPDGTAAAVCIQDEHERDGLSISSPLGSPLKRCPLSALMAIRILNYPAVRFSPDGKSILFLFDEFNTKTRQAWLIPFPVDLKRPPRRVLRDLPGYGFGPSLSWEPDSRHVVISEKVPSAYTYQLFEADISSGAQRLVVTRTGDAVSPDVSPDGRRLLFTEQVTNYNIVSAALDGSRPKPLIATDRDECMPAWAAKQDVLAYVTQRNGPPEIWLRSGNSDRPVVTARDFPHGTTIPSWPPQSLRMANGSFTSASGLTPPAYGSPPQREALSSHSRLKRRERSIPVRGRRMERGLLTFEEAPKNTNW